MAEFLHNAWSGWTGYTEDGKLPALLLAVLLYLWFGRKQIEQQALLLYTSVAAICCILPVTAAGLMMYQTKFYNYEWIWSLVPLTGMTAYGITVFWGEYREQSAGDWRKALPVALLMLTAVLFCGSLGSRTLDREERRDRRKEAYAVLDGISARFPEADVCLWAPREIMEYARERNPRIRLPYGRNIWDDFLNAYAYDVYGEDVVLMEQWMEHVSTTGDGNLILERQGEELPYEAEEAVREGDGQSDPEEKSPGEYETGEPGPERAGQFSGEPVVTLEDSMEKALNQGVNCILLSGEAGREILERTARVLGTEPERIEGFYLFFTGEEELYGQ